MSSRFALLVAPVALLFGTGVASAQHHGGVHHGGAVHGGAYHGGAYHGGYAHGAYYHGGYPYYGHHHNNGWAVGLGIGIGLGYGFGGYGYGSPYYGGYADYGGYYPYYAGDPYYGGYAVAPAVIASPAPGGYYISPSVGGPVTNGYYSSSGNGYSAVAPASTVISAASTNGSVPPAAASSPAPATFTMNVPENAQVWFDGKETEKSTTRTYTSPALEPGKPTVLAVTMEINGSKSEMRVPLRAGDKMSMDVRR